MTSLVVSSAVIFDGVLNGSHRLVKGTDDGVRWHRRHRIPFCPPCRDVYDGTPSGRKAHSVEFDRLLDAGVNPTTAAYLAAAMVNRVTRYLPPQVAA